ncbi:MAG TPA: bacillithiol biosynthesis deacetylase BshB1 [Bacteroidia bacterium]|nr:bacillithiol biosynthesis deacetylase BshB1 [Bacteroidia bacterium]HNS13622.1 bacillithiol biosynthesis deacetylase BshB1 [Bacteroidia bacterium]
MKLDILAFAAHPDDVELACSGTMILHAKMGLKTGIIDLSLGELGTRGDAQTRASEAEKAKQILGLQIRENLQLRDGFIVNDNESRIAVIKKIRKYQPDIILCNAVSDRHPDHGAAAKLVSDAVFLAGLLKLVVLDENKKELAPWTTPFVYHYIQDRHIRPDFVIDVSSVWEERMKAVLAYSSQFYDPKSKEPDTAISSKDFIDFLPARAREMGRQAGVSYAEGFTVERIPAISSLKDLR